MSNEATIQLLFDGCAARDKEIAKLRGAITEAWPHMTGHCFHGPMPECFGAMRDAISAVMPELPYATPQESDHA